ncbi:MAG: 4-oxalocrotonate tautomerase family protein [Sulfuricella sp.]|nr:4-oxalocrotonate tautomerase family protein [Sulfuricella sp.]
MPYLNAKLSAPPSAELTAAIAARLTELTDAVLHKKRELTSVAVEYVPPAQWFIGGESLAALGLATFYLDVKVTEGTNSKDEKALYVAQVFAAVAALVGDLHPTSYIVIHEVRGDAWGYQGKTQEFRYVQGKPN